MYCDFVVAIIDGHGGRDFAMNCWGGKIHALRGCLKVITCHLKGIEAGGVVTEVNGNRQLYEFQNALWEFKKLKISIVVKIK